MPEILYQTSAYEYTEKQTAREFARKWFDTPREIDEWQDANTFRPATFTLVNGAAKYHVVFCPAIPFVSSPSWKVYRVTT